MHRISRDAPDHPLFPLAALGTAQGFTGAQWPYGCAATRAALDPVLPEPTLSLALLRRYVRGLGAALPAPADRSNDKEDRAHG